ncbi:hypothetical protein QL285_002696 [Trifolium repens]|nr:hypothetical protein QL285_002696 [Trifolium repens]
MGSVETKLINSLNCWGLGILLVVMGSLKLKKDVKCSNFVQTMYLVPRGKKDEASSSTSASVAKAGDIIQENIDAPKIEESVIVQEQPSRNSDDINLPPSSTSRGRGRGRGRIN